MEAKFWRAALCVAVSAFLNLATASTVVDTAEFFRSFAGQYRIVMHGGEVPHSNTVAFVEPLEDQGFMQMGYCPSGGGFCDVGYLDFAYSQTRVEKTELSEGRLLFRIQVAATQRLLRFEWEVDADRFRFRNLQYPFPSGEVAVLEHELKAIPGAMDHSNESQVSIEPVDFIQTHLGNYKIETHAGVKPQANSIGTVEALEGGGLMAFGYCDENLGFCDIGYREFPYASTTVLMAVSATLTRYSITAVVEGKTTRYEWVESGNWVQFRTFDYELPNGTLVPILEHVLTRM